MTIRGVSPGSDNPGKGLGLANLRWSYVWSVLYNGLTLAAQAVGFTIAGGTTSKTLTVEDTSLVNQDLTTDAGPTFDHLHLINNLILANGKGIDFSATSDTGGMTGELFNDYEIGTWTCGISFGGGTTGITYQSGYTTGNYTKIGNICIVSCFIILTNKGSSVGSARITGLPYTVLNTAQSYSSVNLRLVLVSFADCPMGYCEINATTVLLEESTNAGARSDLANTDFVNSSTVIFSAVYRTA